MGHIREALEKAKSAGDVFELAKAVRTKQEAQIFLREYVQVIIKSRRSLGKEITKDEALSVAQGNLGYFAGYYGEEVRKHIEELFDCAHPVFGKVKDNKPTALEALYAGLASSLGPVSEPGQRARLRPENYYERPANEQWEIDKGLGLLDWDGN